MRRSPRVSRLIETNLHPIVADVQQIGCPGAIYVSESHASRVETLLVGEAWRVVHRDLRAETAVTEIGPVTHFTVAHANDVLQAVTRHIRERDGLRLIREDHSWSAFFIERIKDSFAVTETFRAQRRIEREHIVFRDQNVCLSVAGEIDELQVRLRPVQTWQRLERLERFPIIVDRALEEAGDRRTKVHVIEPAFARDIE